MLHTSHFYKFHIQDNPGLLEHGLWDVMPDRKSSQLITTGKAQGSIDGWGAIL
jgi:hypothetical protein